MAGRVSNLVAVADNGPIMGQQAQRFGERLRDEDSVEGIAVDGGQGLHCKRVFTEDR